MVSIATNKFMAILNIRWPFKMYSNAAISKEVNNLFTTKKKNIIQDEQGLIASSDSARKQRFQRLREFFSDFVTSEAQF